MSSLFLFASISMAVVEGQIGEGKITHDQLFAFAEERDGQGLCSNIPSTFMTKAEICGMDPMWYGARPPRNLSAIHRRGWESCLRCGGSERLGHIVEVGDARELGDEGVSSVLDAVRAYGVIVIKGQNLSRSEQVAFSRKLGNVVVLPASFEGNDPEPGEPAIQRVTNFWANGTWKGPTSKFGAYWHQDGQFWTTPQHNILSMLHAQRTPPMGGETGFADLRAARVTLSPILEKRTESVSIVASVRDIADFRKGDEADLARFPMAHHAVLANHALDNGPLLYLGSPHMAVEGLPSAWEGRALLDLLFQHATSPSFTYFHAWDAGDVLIWDNTQTLHHSMPYDNDGSNARELYRTQVQYAVERECIKEE